ncbi:MAG: hypothetical protein HUK20_02280 [Fibrobacter sp.]|nr:hypothetical protein [Fibrobacter sp.]
MKEFDGEFYRTLYAGKRLISWSKIMVAFCVILAATSFYIERLPTIMEASTIAGALLLLFVCGIGVLLCISMLIIIVYFIKWIYGSLKTLHRLNLFSGSYLLVTLLCIIPFIGQFVYYFTYRKMVNGLQKYLTEGGATFVPISMRAINASLILCILQIVVDSVSGYFNISTFVGLGLSLLAVLALIWATVPFIGQEEILGRLLQQQFIDKKVGDAIWEREIHKAAEQVQATYPGDDKVDENKGF